MAKGSRWRMARPCANCPWNETGPGRRLRDSLMPGRWQEIVRAMLAGEHFTCHKTTEETGDGSRLLCAGALRFQCARGVSSNYQRVAERLDWLRAERNKKSGAAHGSGEQGDEGTTV